MCIFYDQKIILNFLFKIIFIFFIFLYTSIKNNVFLKYYYFDILKKTFLKQRFYTTAQANVSYQ